MNRDLVVPSYGNPEILSLHNSRSVLHESTIKAQQACFDMHGTCMLQQNITVHFAWMKTHAISVESIRIALVFSVKLYKPVCDQQGCGKTSIGKMEHSIECTGFPACFDIISKARAKMPEATRCTHMRTYYRRAALC